MSNRTTNEIVATVERIIISYSISLMLVSLLMPNTQGANAPFVVLFGSIILLAQQITHRVLTEQDASAEAVVRVMNRFPLTTDALKKYDIQTPLDMAYVLTRLQRFRMPTMFGSRTTIPSSVEVPFSGTGAVFLDYFQDRFGRTPFRNGMSLWQPTCLVEAAFQLWQADHPGENLPSPVEIDAVHFTWADRHSSRIYNFGIEDPLKFKYKVTVGDSVYTLNLEDCAAMLSFECRSSKATHELMALEA